MKNGFKRLACLILCLCAALELCAQATDIVAEGFWGDHQRWQVDSDGVLTISGSGAIAVGYTQSMYFYSRQIQRIQIEEGITSIGHNALNRNWVRPVKVTLPSSMVSIKSYAFWNSDNLEEINFPEGLTAIGESAFRECCALTEAAFPESLTSIDGLAFSKCSSLKNVAFPESLATLGFYSFAHCVGLTEVRLPKSLASIGDGAFLGCTNLTNVIFPENLTSIKESAFRDCASLREVRLPAGLIKIDRQAFEGCAALETVALPEGLLTLGEGAFNGCTALREVSLPLSLSELYEHTFDNCESLSVIRYAGGEQDWESVKGRERLPAGVTVLFGTKTVSALDWTLDGDGLLTIRGNGRMSDYPSLSATPWNDQRWAVKSIRIEPGVTSVGKCAFQFWRVPKRG